MLVLLFGGLARADALKPVETHAYRPYPPIELTSYVFTEPRPVRAWTVKVDLASPIVEFVVTPHDAVGGGFDTASATTLEFARSNGVQVAVNATPFQPLRDRSGEGMDVVGLSVSDGDVYSAGDPRFGALIISKSGEAQIIGPRYDVLNYRSIEEAVGGFRVLVAGGMSRMPQIGALIPESFAGVNPRTAVGLSADRKTMWLVVADGRIPGRSEGFTLTELADFGISLGCDRLLNLDGGGSSTLVVQDPASKVWRVVNQPVGRKRPDTLRCVANNLGVRIRSAGTGK